MIPVLHAIVALPPALWDALWLTLRLAAITTLFLLCIGIPLAYWLNASRCRLAALMETLVSLPIVLPPSVIGFYLLVAFAPQHGIGQLWQAVFGKPLAFSFAGLVAGSVIYSLPFAVQPFQAAFRQGPKSLLEGARALGASAWSTFWQVTLPAAKRGVWVGTALSFAHTVGEFGVVLMIGGNIPGETRVASIALYDEAQQLNYATAHAYALVLLLMSFVMLLAITYLQRKQEAHE